MAVDSKALEEAKADIVAETASDSDALIKSLVGIVDRMSKSGFGDTDKAHNGNTNDKSSPSGGGDAPDGYKSADDEEEDQDGAKGRVARSLSRSRGSNEAQPTTLDKSLADEDEESEESEKSQAKSKTLAKAGDEDEEPLTTQKTYERIAKGEGPAADDYRQVVDASDAIQYITDELVKAIVHVSKQVAKTDERNRRDIDRLNKSFAEARELNVALAKSMAHILKEQESLAKSESTAKAPKSDGRVVIVTAGDKPATGEVGKATLLKSMSKALAAGTVDPGTAANVSANLDAVPDVKAYWGTLPKSFTDAVAAAGAV